MTRKSCAVEMRNAILRNYLKLLFKESELVSGDSEAIKKFPDKYIVPEKLVAEHLAQIKMPATRRRRKRLKGSEWND